MKKIIIIGGGAGGLKLATNLGDKVGKTGQAEITLIDKNSYHIWKPLLHEVATGVMNEQVDKIDYAEQGQQHNFQFTQGTFTNIDRENKHIFVQELNDQNVAIAYDMLVISIGSTANDFGTPGVKDHCIFLDDQNAAIRLRETLVSKFSSFCSIIDEKESADEDMIRIAIVGGGATGVELAAELPHMIDTFGICGHNKMRSNLLDVSVIEAADRILPALPEKTALNITKTLQKSGIHVLTKTMITKAESDGFYPKEGDTIKADIMIWTAGVKAPDYLKEIAGLKSSRSNQLVVKQTLQTTLDDNIFVIGDCAYAMQDTGKASPPTAQAAHQMAKICHENIISMLDGKKLKSFKYIDNGTIISLHDTAQGVVKLAGKSEISVAGWFALIIHRLLYRMHQASLLGIFKMIRFARTNRVIYKTKSSAIFTDKN